ncbi:MAG: hypothetical protein ABIK86_07315 [candidate division WOR-3 bacterium]
MLVKQGSFLRQIDAQAGFDNRRGPRYKYIVVSKTDAGKVEHYAIRNRQFELRTRSSRERHSGQHHVHFDAND